MVEGFVYAADADPGPTAGAGVGDRVRTPFPGPPWIVVDHAIGTVIASRWPGRLLRVAGVPPADEAERDALERAAENLRADAGYTRVLAVDVLAELPPWILFGEHGRAVADVLERARRLDIPDARALAAERHPEADDAYSRAWRRWLDGQPNGAFYRDGDHSRTLAVPVLETRPAQSPVGPGFTLTWTCVRDSARGCAGPAAFRVDAGEDEEDEGDEVLLDPWATAGSALMDAAMALGAPDLVGPADAAVLTRAWRVTTGTLGTVKHERLLVYGYCSGMTERPALPPDQYVASLARKRMAATAFFGVSVIKMIYGMTSSHSGLHIFFWECPECPSLLH